MTDLPILQLAALMVAGFVTVLAPMLAGTVCLLFRRRFMSGVLLLCTGIAWSIYLGFLYWRFMT